MKNLVIALSLVLIGAPLAALATPHCQPCPYSCSDLGLGKKDCSQLSEARGLCCVDLTQKGLDLAKEQERLLAQNTATCPAGFKPSERSCSQEERRRGCRDQRVGPKNMGCVSSQFR